MGMMHQVVPGGNDVMEEQQIQTFVHKAVRDKALQAQLALDPKGVIEREGYSSRVQSILLRLVPYFSFERPVQMMDKWWHA